MRPSFAGRMVERRPARRVDRDDVGKPRRQAGIVLQRGPRRDRETPHPGRQPARPMRRVRGHREHGLPARDQVSEQASNAGPAHVPGRPGAARREEIGGVAVGGVAAGGVAGVGVGGGAVGGVAGGGVGVGGGAVGGVAGGGLVVGGGAGGGRAGGGRAGGGRAGGGVGVGGGTR